MRSKVEKAERQGRGAQEPLFDGEEEVQPAPPELARAPDRRTSAAKAAADADRLIPESDAKEWARKLDKERVRGRLPMFVLGAGVSFGVVPLLKDIGAWFKEHIQEDRAKSLAGRLATGEAGRSEVAELFCLLQSAEEGYREIWSQFSGAFLLGNGKQIQMQIEPNRVDFPGLLRANPTEAHKSLAKLVRDRRAWVVSLNFDGLTVKALTQLGPETQPGAGVALHSAQDVRQYFSALDAAAGTPAVIKVRGDVFYARCDNPLCPAAASEQALDRLGARADLQCPGCHTGKLLLQFFFPGFRSKEEAAYPILWETRRFLGSRVSAIIIVGLSGRWDGYLLEFLFDWALERKVPILDVKPPGKDDKVINSFRDTYYPDSPEFHRIEARAGDWLPSFGQALSPGNAQ
jgi:hypothetical protein